MWNAADVVGGISIAKKFAIEIPPTTSAAFHTHPSTGFNPKLILSFFVGFAVEMRAVVIDAI